MEPKWLNEWLHTHSATEDSRNKTKHRVYNQDQGSTASAGHCVHDEHRRRVFNGSLVFAGWMALFDGAGRGPERPEPRSEVRGVRVRRKLSLVREYQKRQRMRHLLVGLNDVVILETEFQSVRKTIFVVYVRGHCHLSLLL